MVVSERYLVCIHCNKPFTEKNVYSKEGWAETQISGMCEKCFDWATEEGDKEEGDED